jgi:hypothetical protein
LMFLPPFAGDSVADSLRSTVLFAAVCVLYAARAYSEERLLARDPVYVDYALAMDQHSLLALLGRIWPCLSFRARLARWREDDGLR